MKRAVASATLSGFRLRAMTAWLGISLLCAPAHANTTIPSDCQFHTAHGVTWEISLCPAGEKALHYRTQLSFRNGQKIGYSRLLIDSPTGGYPTAELLRSTPRFAIVALAGDETTQVMAIDLKRHMMVFNTGQVSGLEACSAAAPEGPFCALQLTCTREQSPIHFNAYLCPEP